MALVEDFEGVAVRQLEHGQPIFAVLRLETEDVLGERNHLVEPRGTRPQPDDALQPHLSRD